MPSLVITRDRGYADSLRSYRVLLDGKLAGTVAPRGELRREIGPGEHVVEVRIDWLGSQPMRFTATGDHHIVVGEAVDAHGASAFEGRPDDAILHMKDLGDTVFYGG